jgi:hypothetical protein
MAMVATAPNNSSDDPSGTEIEDKKEEPQEEEITEDSECEASITDGFGNDVGKIAKLQKNKKRSQPSTQGYSNNGTITFVSMHRSYRMEKL